MTVPPTIRARIDARFARESRHIAAWAAPNVVAVVGLIIATGRFGLGGASIVPLWGTLITFGLAWLTVWTSRNHHLLRPATITCWAADCAAGVATVGAAILFTP